VAKGFTCEVDEQYRSACEGLAFYAAHEGKRYCVLHFPGEKDSTCFRQAISDKLEVSDFNFSGAYFPNEVGEQFMHTSFKTRADFHRAFFEKNADFGGATFEKRVTFSRATFGGRRTLVGPPSRGRRTSSILPLRN
jgi:Pentapeptide repeats (9 copies)